MRRRWGARRSGKTRLPAAASAPHAEGRFHRVVRALRYSIVAILAFSALGGTLPSLAGPPSVAAGEDQAVQGTVHREGKETYRLKFSGTGTVTVEVSGFPADCALQVGSMGFGESDSSPVGWSDGQPGQPVKHSFAVQAGRPGTVWVELRNRVSAVSRGNWTAVACSKDGPYYTTPPRDGVAEKGPETFEDRPVRPPITFTLTAKGDWPPPSAASKGEPTGARHTSGANGPSFTAESVADPSAALLPLDEAEAMSRVRGSPTAENKRALAMVRIRHAWALLEAARRLKDADGLQLACQYAESATELAPELAAGWIVLAQVYLESGNSAALTLAEDAASKALAIEPANASVRLLLAQVQFKERFFDSAAANFEKAVSARPALANPRVVSMMSLAYLLDGQAARGEKFFADFLVKQAEADSARLALAILLHHQGKDASAREQLRKVEHSAAATSANRTYAGQLGLLWSREGK